MQRIQSPVDVLLCGCLWLPLAFVVLEHSHFCKVAVQEPMSFHKPAKLLVLVRASHHILIQIDHSAIFTGIGLSGLELTQHFSISTLPHQLWTMTSHYLQFRTTESPAFIPRITKNTTVRRVLPWGKWRIKNAVLRAHTEGGTLEPYKLYLIAYYHCRFQPPTKPSLCLHITMPATPTFVSRSSDKRNRIYGIVFSLRSAQKLREIALMAFLT